MPDHIPFRWPGEPVAGRLRERPNRFLARVEIGGEIVGAQVADPGRLEELLRPEAPVYVMPTPGPKRATAHTVVLAATNGPAPPPLTPKARGSPRAPCREPLRWSPTRRGFG
jgi:hypothetical protein